ncbi:MAG TPA: ABC transporter ATP-binding protein [Tenuifilaceae bacterium]|mgnify:CR=1 FL=1|jgi:ABC-2 type transport system ATP-binding protein|nr:ATP-binding cassette domain-containing protein [Bacteroidales bacterium]HNY08319.1 ABC transporter ATP-binding protein [Tenuifilaceae bacterium]MBP8642951.1 ATP-binding cassette domain-containing protein [Bacteroidales bacterium]HOA10261.1 ABC transporter ATP-binding protein [Tenuifilaceae bacterium]HOC36258.1 ABC transporter ATP-binding protein [Tenuifilaceae bacterium]
MNLLETHGVEKRFSNHLALDDISIAIPKGSIYGLLGPNGAGKTTLIRIINQITGPDKGEVMFDGRKIEPNDIYRIGYLPEERGLYKKMKVGEQALFFSQLKGLSRQDATKSLKYWFEKFEIQSWWDKKIEELSKGMAQKVQFIVTVIHKPELLIFDEPFSGFDPINTQLITDEILELKKNGTTIIFSTHNMESVEQLCDHITLINKSKNILSGQIDQVRANYGSNVFEVAFKGNLETLRQNLNGTFDIFNVNTEKAIPRVQVRLQSASDSNKLLQSLISSVEVLSFNPVVPSMHDIFIRVVQEYNKAHGLSLN